MSAALPGLGAVDAALFQPPTAPNPLDASGAIAGSAGALTAAPSATGSFARLMDQQIGALDADVHAAQTAMHDLAGGRPVELHDVMISLERARISVQAFVQIRNRLVESYQDLMRMQM